MDIIRAWDSRTSQKRWHNLHKYLYLMTMPDSYDLTKKVASDGGERQIADEAVPDDPGFPILTNVSIARDPSQEYEGAQVGRFTMRIPPEKVIDESYTIEEAEELIGEFFGEFPTDEPLVAQSGLWMRFFAGFHLFKDANHRTGMETLSVVTHRSGIEALPFRGDELEDRTREAQRASRRVRSPDGMTSGDVIKKDDLYEVWHRYFEDVLGQ